MSGATVTNNGGVLPQAKRVLQLYRKLLKIGKAMPTETRSALVMSRVKADFRSNKAEKDPQEIENMIQLAEIQVDNLEIQREHLTELSKNPNLIIPVDIYKNAKPRISRFMKGPPLSWERKAAQEAKDRDRLTQQQHQQHQQQPQQQKPVGSTGSEKLHHGSPGHSCQNHKH
ncbi:hypothetical protein BX616_000221 [Lobosporangium transversale]|uniref:Complex 1 LYR protein domain-containing protein n=1 Tax=Lobosporangium transversale TaxID=64571 RepID=A0A1Y2H1S6_9FUNG|nr:hypothetical protein BCR41DRAFT_383293 [Lobosporangium transversale]KAF9908185.1 hypothetical protein BX616_000221 [Lobosporangium transversale]ORZ28486.1 hypothetical protein BCR41DRAFT_383293 [Lobosporangium transversale]|eukprot:XP_021886171.1 hypothetical protein BCR41DRAFT_383293 [Lobosporangium transversale]